MYSKSANVNDLVFAWTGWSPSAWPSPPPCFYIFCARWFAMPFRDTHPYICPWFWRKHFYTPLFLSFLLNANCTRATADHDLLERLPNNSGNKGMCSKCMAGCVAHCGMWLGGQPRVGCGGWVGARCITFVWLGYHFAELAVIWARTAELGGYRAVAPQKLLI